MLHGEITAETTSNTVADLQHHLETVQHVINSCTSSHNVRVSAYGHGLRGELLALYNYWDMYEQQASDVVAIPASIRADNGEARPGETHDLVLLALHKTSDGSQNEFIATGQREVKINSAFKFAKKAGRYASALLGITISPAFTLNPPAGFTVEEFLPAAPSEALTVKTPSVEAGR